MFAADDCLLRWRQVLKKLDTLAPSQDKQGAADTLRQFVIDSDRSDPTCSYLPLGLNRLGSLEQDQGHYPNAERRRSLELRIARFGENHPDVALAYSNLAADLFQEKKYAEAGAVCQKALAIWERYAPQDKRISSTYGSLAMICLKQKDYGQAVEQAQHAARIEQQNGLGDKQRLARYSYILALAYEKQERTEESRTAFQRAVAYLKTVPAPSLKLEADVLQDYSRLLKQLGSGAEARTLALRARALRSEFNLGSGLGYSVDLDDLSSTHRTQARK